MSETKLTQGRPSKRTPEIVEAICLRLSHGETLQKICSDDEMPHYSTVWRWEQEDEEFCKVSARARDIGTHYIADDCMNIADNPTIDPADKRIRIDTRMRLIGKWNAKRYGDKVDMNLGGQPDGVPVQTKVTVEFVSAKTDSNT
jgi:hypothetical protein